MSLFSTELKVPITVLQEQAKTMNQYVEDSEDIFDEIYDNLLCLEGSGEWKGESMTAAANAARGYKDKYNEVIEEMRQMADFLENFADEMAAKDAEMKAKIDAM